MKKAQYTFFRDLCLLELETKAREMFTDEKTGLAPTVWTVESPIFTKDEIKKERTKPIVDRVVASKGRDWEKHGSYTTWLNLSSLITAAEKISPGFQKMYELLLASHKYEICVSLPSSSSDVTAKDVYNSLKLDLVNLFFLKKYGLPELNLWLANPAKSYMIPQGVMATVRLKKNWPKPFTFKGLLAYVSSRLPQSIKGRVLNDNLKK